MEDIKLIFKEKVKKVRTKNTEKKAKPKKVSKKQEKLNQITASLVLPDKYQLVNNQDKLDEFVREYSLWKKKPNSYVFLDTETYGINPFKDRIISISVGFNNKYYNIPLVPFKSAPEVETLEFQCVVDTLKPLFENDYELVLHNSKYDVHILYNWTGIDITFNTVWDTMICAKLLDENSSASLKDWYINYAVPHFTNDNTFNEDLSNPTFKFGDTFNKTPFDSIPPDLATYYACHDVFMTQKVFEYQQYIFDVMSDRLGRVLTLFKEVEMPLVPVLTSAERRGIKLDSKFLKDVIGKVLEEKAKQVKEEIFSLLGKEIAITKTKQRSIKGIKFQEEYIEIEELNLSSPKQIVQKLYEEHKILEPTMEYDKELKKEVEKMKTDKSTLVKNKKKHRAIELLLEYRGLNKLIDAFVYSLPESVIDGRIHPSYNSMVRTGRMSCSNPNLCGAL